jgi:hypothetical protein
MLSECPGLGGWLDSDTDIVPYCVVIALNFYLYVNAHLQVISNGGYRTAVLQFMRTEPVVSV